MDERIKNQWVKSAAAVLCVAAICISTLISGGKIADTVKNKATGSNSSAQSAQGEAVTEIAADGSVVEVSTDANGETVTDTTAAAAAQQASDSGTASANQSSASTKASSGTAATTAANALSTKAGIINYCNTALNKVKSLKAGYDKHYVMNVKGETTGSIGSILKTISKDQTTTMKKGSDSTKDFPASGFSWSSKLRESDVASATCKQNGQYYEITLKLGTEKNPAKGESSSYGRVMSVIDANEAKNMVPGVKSIDMTYHDGYVYAKIDSKTGRIVNCELSATADVNATITILGNITAKDIVSTETYTNFVW
jgi:hypothetical protein